MKNMNVNATEVVTEYALLMHSGEVGAKLIPVCRANIKSNMLYKYETVEEKGYSIEVVRAVRVRETKKGIFLDFYLKAVSNFSVFVSNKRIVRKTVEVGII